MRKTRASNLFEYHCVTTVEKNRKRFLKKALNISPYYAPTFLTTVEM